MDTTSEVIGTNQVAQRKSGLKQATNRRIEVMTRPSVCPSNRLRASTATPAQPNAAVSGQALSLAAIQPPDWPGKSGRSELLDANRITDAVVQAIGVISQHRKPTLNHHRF